MNPFKTLYQIEKNGRVYTLHWKHRHDPMTMAMVGMAAGTGIQMYSQYKQGRLTHNISEQRADVDRARAAMAAANAEAVMENAKTESQVRADKGRRLLATQKAAAAAGGIRVNTGAPLVVEAETREMINKDIGYVLREGQRRKQGHKVQEYAFLQSADIEEQIGDHAREQSYWDMAGTAIKGFGSMAFMGQDAYGGGGGWGGGTATYVKSAGGGSFPVRSTATWNRATKGYGAGLGYTSNFGAGAWGAK